MKMYQRVSTDEIEERRFTVASQDPVHKLMASLLTPKQLTRFSCPFKFPTRSPLNTSQTYSRYTSAQSPTKLSPIFPMVEGRIQPDLALKIVITGKQQPS